MNCRKVMDTVVAANKIAELEAVDPKFLSDIDKQLLVYLREVARGIGGNNEFFATEQVLRDRLGPRYNEYVRRRANHDQELERLKAINEELQKQADLACELHGGPGAGVPTYIFGPDADGAPAWIPNATAIVLDSLKAQQRTPPGTYVVEVDENHKFTSFKVEPNKTVPGLIEEPLRVGFWSRVWHAVCTWRLGF